MELTGGDLDRIATAILTVDADRESCRGCGEPGEATGREVEIILLDAGKRQTEFAAIVREYRCPNRHTWYEGEGKRIGSETYGWRTHKSLADERREREELIPGAPDPSYASGVFSRTWVPARKQRPPEAE